MTKKYELDYMRDEESGHHEIIAILTGHSIEDIKAVSPNRDIWHTSDYIKAFNALGFNCNDRFIKFNPATDKPCMMRFTYKSKIDHYWHAFAYYDHKVYYGKGEWFKFDRFIEYNTDIRVTSMLQVWI